MKHRLTILFLALLAPLLVGVTGCSASASTSDPLAAWHDALAHADTAQANIIWLGSSSTYGTGASSPERRYINVATDQLRGSAEAVNRVASTYPTRNASPGVHGYSSAAGGLTSENYVNDSTRPWIMWERPSLVVHMIGSNDSIDAEPYAVSVADYESNVAYQIDRIDASTSSPVSHLLVHTYRRAGVSVAKWRTYREALDRIAATRDNVAVLDISAEFEARDHLGADPDGLLFTDGVHPSDVGHAFMGSLIADALTGSSQVLGAAPWIPAVDSAVEVPVVTSSPTPTVSVPSRPAAARAVRQGTKKIAVTWRGDADHYQVTCGRSTLAVDRTRAVVRSTASACKVRALSGAGNSPWIAAKVRRA